MKRTAEEWDKWWKRKNHGSEFMGFIHDEDLSYQLHWRIDSGYELSNILTRYVEWLNKVTEEEILTDDDIAKETIKYIKLIKVQARQKYGLVMYTDDFIETVRGGLFIDYDGCGCFLNEEGEEDPGYPRSYIRCDVDWLEAHKENHPYVIWFNK